MPAGDCTTPGREQASGRPTGAQRTAQGSGNRDLPRGTGRVIGASRSATLPSGSRWPAVDRLGPLAERVPTTEAPGDEPPDLVIHNDRARNELGWRPRPAETTIVETAESLRDLGLLGR